MNWAKELRRWGDELRSVSEIGLAFSQDDPYHRERYEHVRHVAADLFAAADLRPVHEIERTVFRELTHVAPMPATDAAIIDDEDRIFLIRRADDQLWAMPGGGTDMGETAAQVAEREAREEAGLIVHATDLIGVWDSRFCETRSALQLYQFVFLCRVTGTPVAPTTPGEVIGTGWFAESDLPPLSPGHTVRVPAVFDYLRERRVYFDETLHQDTHHSRVVAVDD